MVLHMLRRDAEKFSIWPAFILGNLSYHDSTLPGSTKAHSICHLNLEYQPENWDGK